MEATHRVKDLAGNIIGFLVEGTFYADYVVKEKVRYIDNLFLEDGAIQAKTVLSEISLMDGVNKPIYQKLIRENPFERDIQKEFMAWKEDPFHVVMQLDGSRQIGKTTELLKFAYKNYEYVIYVDISKDKDFTEVIRGRCTPMAMEEYCQKALLPRFVNSANTILILDEIQAGKEVYNSIRELHQKLDCDIAVTGSYLGRRLGDQEFFLPAGTISYTFMFNLSFAEFCRVFHGETVLKSIDLYGRGSAEEYQMLENLYRVYIKVGGYPEVVKRYLQTEDPGSCFEVIGKLLYTFEEESRNYFKEAREVEIFGAVYREALKEMCGEKRGTGKNVLERVTSLTHKSTDLLVNRNEVGNAVMWLKYAGILGTCDLAVDGDMRNLAYDRRLYFSDCGIVSYLVERSMVDQTSLTGLLTETFVYNELHRLFKVPYRERKVMEEEVCFAVYGNYELDFMVADKNRVVYGIEVKTKGGEPVSLKVFIKKHLVDKGIVAKPTKGGQGEFFDTIPVYAVGCRFPYR